MKAIIILCLFSIAFIYAQIPRCGSQVACCRSVSSLKSAGFSGKDLNIAAAVAFFESRWGQNKGPNRNSDGSYDYGLLQLNSYLWCSQSGNNKDCCCPGTWPKCRSDPSLRTCACGCNLSCKDAHSNDVANAKCALQIIRTQPQKWNLWAGYTSNKAACDRYVIEGC